MSVPQLQTASRRAVGWFERHQYPDGTWLYEYDVRRGQPTASAYNIVRHAGAMLGLYQAASAGIPGALASGDRGLDWILDRTSGDGRTLAVDDDDVPSTGGSALLAAALLERRRATGDAVHDDQLRQLGRFLTQRIEPSGAVVAPAPGDDRQYSKYATGQTYWVLAELAGVFPDGGWGEPAARVERYLATSRDRAEDRFPPTPDHWSAYGLDAHAATSGARLDATAVAFAHRQAELFGFQVRSVGQVYGPLGRVVRGTRRLRGGGYGVIGEALGELWRLGGRDGRVADIRGAVADRALCNAGLAVRAQSASGAWYRHGITRMDDQQHALSALLKAAEIRQATAASRDSRHVNGWLAIVALVALLNPFRVRRGVDRRAVAAAVVALVVAAALGDVVLRALDVSVPSARLAAGVLVALAGAVDLFRRSGEPVGLPAALVVALLLGADAGVGVVLVAGVLAAAMLFVPVEGRARTWAGRLLACVAVATGMLLVVSGVLAV